MKKMHLNILGYQKKVTSLYCHSLRRFLSILLWCKETRFLMFDITHNNLVPIKSVRRTISPFIRMDMFGSSLHTINHVCVRNKVYCEQLIMEFKFLFQKYCEFMHTLQLLQMFLSWHVNH